jgi:3-dehydroquinate dehydratase/shikimate dehydrogenase
MSWNCQVPIIGLVMGEMGLISRILCAKSSGYLTFGTLESGFVSAPGQPTIKDLLDLYNFRQIGPDTKVFGIIGKPVGHSKSPFLYNEAFKSVGFNGVYVHLLVDDIANFLQTCSSTDFAGFRFYFYLHHLLSNIMLSFNTILPSLVLSITIFCFHLV